MSAISRLKIHESTSTNTGCKQHLLNLPNDILREILILVNGGKFEDIEISVQRRIRNVTYGKKWREERHPIFDCFRINNLLRCSKAAREAVLSTFEAYNTFYSDNTEGFQRLPRLLYTGFIPFIRKLELRMDDYTKTHDEQVFPELLEVLCEGLKSLREFKLFGDVGRNHLQNPFCERGRQMCFDTTTRQQQEVRVLLRLIVFVVMRHPILKRLIWPKSGIIPDPDDKVCLIENFFLADAGQCDLDPKDSVLNASALSLIEWPGLAQVNLSDYTLPLPPNGCDRDLESSILPHPTGYFAPVAERAYRTKHFCEWRGWQHRDVDELIQKCKAVAAEASSIGYQEQLARDAIDWHVRTKSDRKRSKLPCSAKHKELRFQQILWATPESESEGQLSADTGLW